MNCCTCKRTLPNKNFITPIGCIWCDFSFWKKLFSGRVVKCLLLLLIMGCSNTSIIIDNPNCVEKCVKDNCKEVCY